MLAVAFWRDAFRRVDHVDPLAVARLARRQGARTFGLTSAMGADARSSVFYNRVKVELEAAIAALDFPALVLVRPGLFDGERSERRCRKSDVEGKSVSERVNLGGRRSIKNKIDRHKTNSQIVLTSIHNLSI